MLTLLLYKETVSVAMDQLITMILRPVTFRRTVKEERLIWPISGLFAESVIEAWEATISLIIRDN